MVVVNAGQDMFIGGGCASPGAGAFDLRVPSTG